SEIPRFSILNKHIAKHHPEPSSRLVMLGSRLLHFQRILAEIGYVQIVQNPATVCVRVRSHAAVTARGEFRKFRDKRTVLVEQFLRLIAAHPLFKGAQMGWVRSDLSKGD